MAIQPSTGLGQDYFLGRSSGQGSGETLASRGLFGPLTPGRGPSTGTVALAAESTTRPTRRSGTGRIGNIGIGGDIRDRIQDQLADLRDRIGGGIGNIDIGGNVIEQIQDQLADLQGGIGGGIGNIDIGGNVREQIQDQLADLQDGIGGGIGNIDIGGGLGNIGNLDILDGADAIANLQDRLPDIFGGGINQLA